MNKIDLARSLPSTEYRSTRRLRSSRQTRLVPNKRAEGIAVEILLVRRRPQAWKRSAAVTVIHTDASLNDKSEDL